jgi:hypothetical protein
MKKALIFGINDYWNVGDLQGCINDTIDYQATLAARGFSYTTLTNSMCTGASLRTELNALVDGAQSGDVLAIAWSSHGSNKADTNGDEADGRDELICPVDFPADYITDDELRGIFAKLPDGVTCDVFADCCYAGTITRLVGDDLHKIPVLGNRYVPFTGKSKNLKAKVVIVPTMKESLFAACGEGQTSSEALVGGKPRGIFSYYVCKALRSYPNYTRDQIVNYAKVKIAAIGLTQVPQLECRVGEATQVPFT